jgi:hypothetical protein
MRLNQWLAIAAVLALANAGLMEVGILIDA